MNVLVRRAKRSRATGLAVLGLLIGGVFSAVSGDAIIVGNEKAKAPAPKPGRLGEDPTKRWETPTRSTPLDGLSLPSQPQERSDPRRDKRDKNKQLEKDNWMFVNPGELQEEEDANFGVRDYTLEKEDDSISLMFRDLIRERTPQQPGSPAAARRPGQAPGRNPMPPPPPRDDGLLATVGRPSRDSLGTEASRDSRAGAHTAGELNLKNLLAPAGAEKSELSLRNVLGGGQQASAGQQAVRDEFKNFLNGPQPGPAVAASGDLPGSRNILGGAPLGGLPSRPTDNPLGGLGGGLGVSSLNRSAPSAFNVGPAPGLRNSGQVSGYGSLPPQLGTPARSPAAPPMGSEPFRRKGI